MAAGGGVKLRNPGTGVVFGFGLPLPPAIQRQRDDGILEDECEPVIPAGEQPRGNASHQVWIDYAASQGMSRAEAAAMTRNELRDRFTDPGFDPDKPPEVVNDGDSGDSAERGV